MKSARVILLALVLIALLPLGTGCSSFRRDKKSAAQAHPVAGSIEGLWVGRWYSSQKPSHGGKMEMVLTKTGDTLYRASTRSHWWGLFRSSYDTPLVVTPVRAGEFMILGEKQLWGFGGYTVTGRVDTARMDAGFWVGSNHGRIELQRASVTNAP